MKLPVQSQPINRQAAMQHNVVEVSNAVMPQFYCPFGCGVVNCGKGRYCVDTGFMSCDCVVG